MNKKLQMIAIYMLSTLLFTVDVIAQQMTISPLSATVTNPITPPSTSNFTICSTGTDVTFTVTVSRNVGSTSAAYLKLYTVDVSGKLVNNFYTSPFSTDNGLTGGTWTTSGTIQTLSPTINLKLTSQTLGTYQKVAAVLVDYNNINTIIARTINNIDVTVNSSCPTTSPTPTRDNCYTSTNYCTTWGSIPQKISGIYGVDQKYLNKWYISNDDNNYTLLTAATASEYQYPYPLYKNIWLRQDKVDNYGGVYCYAKFSFTVSLPPPTTAVTTPYISICKGTSKSFSFQSVPGASSYTWQSSNPSLTINGSQSYTGTALSIQINATSGLAPGDYTIRANSNGGPACGPGYTIYKVHVASGIPATSQDIIGNVDGSCTNTTYLTVPEVQGGLTYALELSDGRTNVITKYENEAKLSYYPAGFNVPGHIVFNIIRNENSAADAVLTVSNACGSSRHTTYFVSTLPLCSPQDPYLTATVLGNKTKNMDKIEIYPIPANDKLNLSRPVQQCILIDINGREILNISKNDITEINTHNISSGLYLLKVIIKGESIKYRVQIQH